MAADNKIVGVRVLAAVAGGAAVLALGWLGVTSGESNNLAVHLPPPPPTVGHTVMSLGATTTSSIPPTEPTVSKALPSITGSATLPSEEAGLP